MPTNSLTVTDNRTGKSYELPIQDGMVRAADLRQIRTGEGDFGIMSYDPAYMNTAECRSAITYIDGDKGILRYRGYPIDQLAEKSTFLETSYLLLHGELPKKAELDTWVYNVTHHTIIHENIKKFIDGFHHDAHPMGVFVSTVAALSTFYPEAKHIDDEVSRRNQIFRLIAKTPTLAAFAHRHNIGMPYAYPDNDLSYTGNLLNMMFKATEVKYVPNPVLERAMDVLFILHADHEQNCSAAVMRAIGSSHADPYSAMAGAAAALYGPLHGGANEQVLRMLREIGDKSKVPAYIERVKRGEVKLMGFGHRVYRTEDPRATHLRAMSEELGKRTGDTRWYEMSHIIEAYIKEHKGLNANVDFYSASVYYTMGIPIDLDTPIFACSRISGWTAHVLEQYANNRLIRPRAEYVGPKNVPYIPIDQRS